MNKHESFLREEAEIAVQDDLPIAEEFLAAADAIMQLRKAVRSSCVQCRHYYEKRGSRDRDGVCQNSEPEIRPTTRQGVPPGIWSHVRRSDVCAGFEAAVETTGKGDK